MAACNANEIAAVARKLKEIEIETIEQLTNSSPEDLTGKISINIITAVELIKKARILLRDEEEPKVPPGEKMARRYSMKSTQQIDLDENEEENKRI